MSLLRLSFEQQKNLKAMGITLGAHLLLLLFFLLFKYAMPMEVIPEPMGMEVNLGTSEDGFGTDQPEAMGYPAALADQQQVAAANSARGASFNNVMTTDDEQAAGININHTANNRHSDQRQLSSNARQQAAQAATPSPTRTEATQRQPKYTYAGSSGDGQGNDATRNQTGGSEGIGEGTGDMGVPGSTPGASNYSGIPGGRGNISALVGNRHLVETPNPDATYKEGGKVEISVTVNRQGEIVSSRILNAANNEIKAIALQKLKHVRFNKAPNALPEMFGTITFNFVTR